MHSLHLTCKFTCQVGVCKMLQALVSHQVYRIPLLELLSLTLYLLTLLCSLPLLSPFAGLLHTKAGGSRGGGGGRGRKAQRARSCGFALGRRRVRGWMRGNRGSKGGHWGCRGLGVGEKPERQKARTGAGGERERWWEGRVRG